MNDDNPRQMMFCPMIAHCSVSAPYASQATNPATVIAYIRSDSPSVLRVLMIPQACGTKLTMESVAANRLTTVTAFIDSPRNAAGRNAASRRQDESAPAQ